MSLPHLITLVRLLADGFDGLSPLGGEGLKGRVRVQFVDEYGNAEAGVVSEGRDGGRSD